MDTPTAGAGDAPELRSNGSAAPQPGNSSPPDPGQTDPGRDYLGRIQSDPNFATQEVRKHQSAAAKAEGNLRKLTEKLGPLASYLDNVSGDVLAQAVMEYQGISQDPTIAQAIRTFRETGRVQVAPPEANEDAYLTDTERALKTQLDAQEARYRALEQRLDQQTANFGRQSLTQNLQDVFSDYGISGDRAEQVKQSLLQQVDQFARQGDAGRKALADLQSPSGKDTVELLVMRALRRDGLREVFREQDLREGKLRNRMQTDGPYAFGTADDEPPQEHKSVLDGIKAARARPEVLSKYSG